MQNGDQIAFVSCSNGLKTQQKKTLLKLHDFLTGLNITTRPENHIYAQDGIFSGTAQQRASTLMQCYLNPDIKAIFDVSGGDIANEILPYLNFEVLAQSEATFWGYSDLTTIINALYTKTGKASVLYQPRNLILDPSGKRRKEFQHFITRGSKELFTYHYRFIQKKQMDGILVGGNIRCLLKLAGTAFWPDMTNKILLLESLHGTIPQMTAAFSQLKQIGVFEQLNGVLLGQFTQMESEKIQPDMITLAQRFVPENLALAKTDEIGHAPDAKAAIIGAPISLKS